MIGVSTSGSSSFGTERVTGRRRVPRPPAGSTATRTLVVTPVSCRATDASAPGRVNLIGEHTDHQLGLVLPVAIGLRTAVSVRPRDDGRVRLRSGGASVGFAIGGERPTGAWTDHVAGVVWALRAAGHEIGGFDAQVRSTIPSGAGLASSAALGVAVTLALRDTFGFPLADLDVARVAHRSESEFVGARVGLMDHLVASLGEEGVALAIDTRDLGIDRIPLPPGIELGAVHSGIRHANAAGAYNALRRDLEDASARLGVGVLREVDDERALSALPEPLRARARHVVRENARVRAAVAALRAGDAAALGPILREGHASLRDDLGVSTPELDTLVELAWADPDVVAARLTGAGFGGSIVLVAAAGRAAAAGDRIAREYGRRTSRQGRVVLPRPADGARA
ncbi:MAG TPA: galactokinase family protein [Candidatus Limnocylindria bacterium]|nr:galactokinase family protein [Candidatus Limnocylindria bacterium]